MPLHKFTSLIVSALVCSTLIYNVANRFFLNENDLHKSIAIFDAAFSPKVESDIANPAIRRRNGLELFCIVGLDGQVTFLKSVSKIIDEISHAFSVKFQVIETSDFTECPIARSSFFVLIGPNPGNAAIRSALKEITGIEPPVSYNSYDHELGISQSLPGYEAKEFLFIHDDGKGVHGENTKAVFLEILLHSILRARDVRTDDVFTLLGNTFSEAGYETWFDHNPRGLCRIDMIFLGLVLDDLPAATYRFDGLRAHFLEHYEELSKEADVRRDLLESYTDPRCW